MGSSSPLLLQECISIRSYSGRCMTSRCLLLLLFHRRTPYYHCILLFMDSVCLLYLCWLESSAENVKRHVRGTVQHCLLSRRCCQLGVLMMIYNMTEYRLAEVTRNNFDMWLIRDVQSLFTLCFS